MPLGVNFYIFRTARTGPSASRTRPAHSPRSRARPSPAPGSAASSSLRSRIKVIKYIKFHKNIPLGMISINKNKIIGNFQFFNGHFTFHDRQLVDNGRRYYLLFLTTFIIHLRQHHLDHPCLHHYQDHSCPGCLHPHNHHGHPGHLRLSPGECLRQDHHHPRHHNSLYSPLSRHHHYHHPYFLQQFHGRLNPSGPDPPLLCHQLYPYRHPRKQKCLKDDDLCREFVTSLTVPGPGSPTSVSCGLTSSDKCG